MRYSFIRAHVVFDIGIIDEIYFLTFLYINVYDDNFDAYEGHELALLIVQIKKKEERE